MLGVEMNPIICLTAEEKYILYDPDGEAKYNMNLKESLKRARKGREENNRLLERHVFYVTHHVQAEIKMLKNVITACGGTVRKIWSSVIRPFSPADQLRPTVGFTNSDT